MNYPDYIGSLISESGSPSPLRLLLFDPVTGLPTLALMMQSIKEVASEEQRIGIILLHIDPSGQIESEFGWEMMDRILKTFPSYFDSITALYPQWKLYPLVRIPGDSFLLLVYSTEPESPIAFSRLGILGSEIEAGFGPFLKGRIPEEVIPFTRLYHGCSLLEYSSNIRFERQINGAINRAFHSTLNQEERVRQIQKEELKDIVDRDQIRVLLQPIVSLNEDQSILGQEALSRGPSGTCFEQAEYMFTFAASCGLLGSLEQLCQSHIMRILDSYPANELLFVNLEPAFLDLEQYRSLPLFQKPSLYATKVVLEITERIAISDYQSATHTLDQFRDMGFKIAVDDVGSGYASLPSIAYLRPDFIKVSEKMVHGVARDYIKQEILKALQDMGSRFSASLIAEGIETEDDLQKLKDLGIPYGQGYHLKTPAEPLFP